MTSSASVVPFSRAVHVASRCVRIRKPSRLVPVIVLVAATILELAFSGYANAQSARNDGPRNAMRVVEITIIVGEQTTIPSDGVRKIAPGGKGILDVRNPESADTPFVVLGLAPGKATMLFFMRDGTQILYKFTVRTPPRPDEIVPRRDNIRLDIYFVELSKSGGFTAGFAWPGADPSAGVLGATVNLDVTASVYPKGPTTATTTIASQVLPRLDLAQSAGWARVLRHATVIASNGDDGSFSSGGEVNVRVGSGTAVAVQQIRFGTDLAVTPRYDKDTGRLELKVGAEVATLGAVGPDGLPGRNVTKVSTLVNIELGQAVVLAGFLGEDKQHGSRGFPGLSQIPVLGYLFGVKTSSVNQVQNVLIIVPSVSEAIPDQGKRLVRDALQRYRKFHGNFGGTSFIPGVDVRDDSGRSPATSTRASRRSSRALPEKNRYLRRRSPR